MCIIIHREESANLPNDIIEHNRRVNPDGFGIAWRENGKLHSVKFGPEDFEPFRNLLKSIDRKKKVEYVAHFRTATHGPKCEEMSHPFSYNDAKDGEVLVFHNGIIGIQTPGHLSDTAQFVKAVLSKIQSRWWLKGAYKFLVEEAIGYSRLLVMTKDVTVRLNESQWTERNGIWYSTEPIPKYKTGWSGGAKVPYATPSWTPAGSNWNKDSEDAATVVNGLVGFGETVESESNKGWYQSGHYIEALTETHEKGDVWGTAICTICHTIGDFYLIDGTTYVDIRHDDPMAEDDEEDEETMKGVLLA